MHTIYNTLTLLWNGDSRPEARHLGLAVLVAAALVSLSACGTDAESQTAVSTTTASTVTPTTASPPLATTTSPAVSDISPVATTPPDATTAATATTVPRPTMTVDELVGADGNRVHVRCVGEGDTTVLLIAGFGGDASGWVEVEPTIATQARVCSYDRPGTGTSDPATVTATFATQATDLHALLSTIGEPGPYVVVGHSFGGAEAVTFASLYADEVTGLVLVDASPASWPDALCSVADDGSEAAAIVLGNCAGAFLPTGNSEHLDVATAVAEVSGIVSLGSLPMAVVTATERQLPTGLATHEVARLTDTWNQGQQQWVALSTSAHLVSVDDTSHDIQLDQPAVVIDEISGLLP